MNRPYERFTIQDHVTLGNQLKAAWQAQGQVLRAFPKNSRASQVARRLERSLSVLKSALDDEICRLVKQEQDPRHMATKVYYGAPFIEQLPEGQDPQDAFARWSIQK